MNFERGDSVKFGEKWCEEHGRKELINQIVKFSPQWFEDRYYQLLYSLHHKYQDILRHKCKDHYHQALG
ncbi:hypothetical protein ABD91_20865 [Lysinibacillus sphaericus]|uniref:hypothetical protein n=1 Tax=Lysinibacillus sphaericus TaxID=1421 RepID=UPI0018CD6D4C|nr:hypothetical protein [Lysinibacillus sphaericus]MBG9693195.1 hypothetical protein [Lysinibacillus sphaericus]